MWRCYASRSKIKVINEDLFHALWVDYDVDWRFVPFVNCFSVFFFFFANCGRRVEVVWTSRLHGKAESF